MNQGPPIRLDYGHDDVLEVRQWMSRLGPLLGLCFVFMFFTVLTPRTFASFVNIELILRQTAVVGVAALGMTLIIISGGIDLSVGSSIALCSVVIALLLRANQSPVVAVCAGVLAGAACGALIGGVVTGLRLPPFIVTLGMWGIFRGIAEGLANQQMVYVPAKVVDTWLGQLLKSVPVGRRWFIVPAGVWMMLILAGLVAVKLRYTRLGRHTVAVGSNELAARLCGVVVWRTRLFIYITAGALTGVAGVLQFSYLSMGDPTTAAGKELDIIAAVVIGGASLSGGHGSVIGTLLGAIIMTMVSNGCIKMGWPNFVQLIVTGGIIILAVALDKVRHRSG